MGTVKACYIANDWWRELMVGTPNMTGHELYPRAFKAVPIRDAALQEQEATWVVTCPQHGCRYAVQLDDLQIALDAVAGHIDRAHPTMERYRESDPGLPPVALLTHALEEFATGRPGEALSMIREARDRMQQWVVE